MEIECLHILNVMNNRLLDDVETGGGDTQGHGMVLALHLVKHLKSFRKFSELVTKKYHAICHWLHCLHPFHKQITVSTCISWKIEQDVCTLGIILWLLPYVHSAKCCLVSYPGHL